MVATLTFGFRAEPFLREQGPLWSFPVAPGREQLDELIDVVREAEERHGHVLAIYPSWRAEPARRRLETVRAAAARVRIAIYATDLPPLAGAVLASLASAVARHLPTTGALLAKLPVLERELTPLAWVGSVARLSAPFTGLLHHIASWSPGAAFGVFLRPEPHVVLLRKRNRAAVPPPSTARPLCLALSPRGGDRAWIEECVLPAFGSAPVREVPPTDLGPEWWGTPRLIEVVAYPVDVASVASRLSCGLTHSYCKWCREEVATPECPFCRARVERESWPEVPAL